jgi:hypothetical protein
MSHAMPLRAVPAAPDRNQATPEGNGMRRASRRAVPDMEEDFMAIQEAAELALIRVSLQGKASRRIRRDYLATA